MKVELSIKDDSELRAMIKDMIRGQVTNILREDINKIIADALGDKVTKFDALMKTEITRVVKEHFAKSWGGPKSIGYMMIEDEIKKHVAEAFKAVLK